nr:MAG TPA: hypothetical protein [Caudoviricetes sp.]
MRTLILMLKYFHIGNVILISLTYYFLYFRILKY